MKGLLMPIRWLDCPACDNHPEDSLGFPCTCKVCAGKGKVSYMQWVIHTYPAETASRIIRHNWDMDAVIRSMDLRDMVEEQLGRGEWQDIYYSLAKMIDRGEMTVPHWDEDVW